MLKIGISKLYDIRITSLVIGTLFSLILSHTQSNAQFERTAGKIVTDKQPGGIIETWNLEKTRDVEGSYFLNDDWYVGNIDLKDGRRIENVPLKYNLRDDYLHIRDQKGEIHILNTNKIQQFKWFNIENKDDESYVNCSNYELGDTQLTGIAELLASGKCDLLKYHRLILQKGTYSVVHDAGQKYDEYTTKEEFYINKDSNLHKVKNKKTVLAVFGDESDFLEEYIKENRINVKKEEGLTQLIEYYNSL